MKTFLFQGDSITDANRDDEDIINSGLGCGYAFMLASEIEKSNGGLRFINRGKSGDRITDVYSDKDYPQFKYSTNASHTVHAAFDGCGDGILTGDAKNLIVKNVCANSKVRIVAVMCDKLDLSFKVNPLEVLNPGDTVEIPFEGEIPEVSNMAVGVTVYYVMDTVTPVGYRTQTFKLANGNPVAQGEGYVSIEASTGFDYIIPEPIENILRQLGLWELCSMMHTIWSYWVLALAF